MLETEKRYSEDIKVTEHPISKEIWVWNSEIFIYEF